MLECLNFTPREIIEYGVSTFIALSSRHFELLATQLGFTDTYHTDLRTISRTFSETALPSIGLSIPTKNVAWPSYDEAGLIAAWQNAFTEFETINYADIICTWVLKLKFENALYSQVQSNAWNRLLFDWSKNPSDFPALHLSLNLRQEIRILVMLQHMAEVEMHFKFPRVKDDLEMGEWEEYVMANRSLSSWLSNRMRLHHHLTKWVDIFRLMSKRQINILDKWGYNIIKNDYEYFRLNDLAGALQEKGYF